MSDDIMKSALERAMERAESIVVPEEKMRELESRPIGEQIAALFLESKDFDIEKNLEKHDSAQRALLTRIIETVFLQNLVLPMKERDTVRNERVFQGLSSLKSDKESLKQAKEQLHNLSNYYAQATRQNYDQMKAGYEKVMTEAVKKQSGTTANMKFDVTQAPEFQEKWRQLLGQLNLEYGKTLAGLKDAISKIN